jgi:hypothetical protein
MQKDTNYATLKKMQTKFSSDLGENESRIILTWNSGKFDLQVSLGSSLVGFYLIAGYPVLTVPAGYRKPGAPFRLTFVVGPFEDKRLIA